MTPLDPAMIRIDKARLHNARVRDAPRLTRALDQVTPASIGLNPRATLIVRHLALRTPVSRDGSTDRFIAGLRDQLRTRLVSARRGRAGEDNDLYFEDDVALETAIVVAWLDGSSSVSWIHALGAGIPLTRWRRHILPDLQLLPRIIARLVETGIAERWLGHFDATEIRAVTARLLEAYGAAKPVKGHEFTNNSATTADTVDRQVKSKTAEGPIANFFSPEVRSIIRPEVRSIIRPEVRLLVAVALIITRRPTMIATPVFAEALASLNRAQRLAISPPAQPSPLTPSPQRKRPIARSSTPSARQVQNSRHGPGTATTTDKARPLSATQSATVTATPPPPIAIERPVIATDYGGLFFLLNAFLALGLYGDFTRQGDGLKGLSPFELMHLLGARWFGARFKADPIASLLIDLAGLQSSEKPGQSFAPPIWSVPDDWLRPWPDAKSHDFPLIDQPDLTTRRWIDNLARYLRARLRQSLGDRDAVAITCAQPARIMIDRDRIIVHFPLADHPIALRFAGLDRDPGWVPAAAHFVEFKFA